MLGLWDGLTAACWGDLDLPLVPVRRGADGQGAGVGADVEEQVVTAARAMLVGHRLVGHRVVH